MKKFFSFLLFSICITTMLSLFCVIQKMPLSKTTTTFDLCINSAILNAKTDDENKNVSKKNENNTTFSTLGVKEYLIILACCLPIIVVLFITIVPSKKISENCVAMDLKDKPKPKGKIKLGVQAKNKDSFFDEDENL